jgi:3-methyladenine DNA glycosylase AlkD
MNTTTLHAELLAEIIRNSGQATQHTFLDSYLGNSHVRHAISTPRLRAIAKTWMNAHRNLAQKEFLSLLTVLIEASSSTEKVMAGILLSYARTDQLNFNPKIFDQWLNHLEGWAEIDALCTVKSCAPNVIENLAAWKSLLLRLNKSKNINKRRASLVFLCQPLSHTPDSRLPILAFRLIDTLKHEKEILITKAISWVLRSMVKLHRSALKEYLRTSKGSLPAIAVRETTTKLETGKKTPRKAPK